ncbi:hypothetical protein GCM10010123_41370 [Pilimelia anulata]|uniref:DUF4407 domain-containing protein n=1 Tax=Pilimelia anulata TaxID=53371 RepID=A0A8J3BAG8_9ACTN|nr:DUF4407 domain-containing protein [Pilimelia anulata]GGK07242.1 hypothetical protein GCM10010123_41370 [Pilimelia anulata]
MAAPRTDAPHATGRAGGLLIWLSGADPEALAKVPRERRKFVGVGGVVLTTAAMAAMSFAFALTMGAGAALLAAVPAALLWGLAIMNLDRWLVTASQRRERWYQNLAVALPRVFLALIIGAVVSTPLVLFVFQNEINAELNVIEQRELNAHEERLRTDTRFARIPGLETEVAKLQRVVNGGPTDDDTVKDPAVAELEKQYNALESKARAAEKAAFAELDGTGGTGVEGEGAAYRRKQAAADAAKRERDSAKARLDAAGAKLAADRAANAGKVRATAGGQLTATRTELDGLKRLRDLESAKFTDDKRNDRGLLARLSALQELTGHNGTLRAAYLGLWAFIIAIEILPVAVKFLMSLGPPTLYDKVLAHAEKRDIDTAEAAYDLERALSVRELEIRRQREDEAVDGLVERMVAAEVDVYGRAIDDWRAAKLNEAPAPAGYPAAHRPPPRAGWWRGLRGGGGVPRPRYREQAGADGYLPWPTENGELRDSRGSDPGARAG